MEPSTTHHQNGQQQQRTTNQQINNNNSITVINNNVNVMEPMGNNVITVNVGTRGSGSTESTTGINNKPVNHHQQRNVRDRSTVIATNQQQRKSYQ